jgi:hypothetical protein
MTGYSSNAWDLIPLSFVFQCLRSGKAGCSEVNPRVEAAFPRDVSVP